MDFISDLIFEHYASVAQLAIAIALPLMLVAILVTRKTGKLRAAALALIAYVAVVALGMSSEIKHLSLIGFAHALIAFAIAVCAARHLNVRAAWVLLVPCFFIAVVVLFNIANQNMGLELMGRWNKAG